MSYFDDDGNVVKKEENTPVAEGKYCVALEDIRYSDTRADGTASDPRVSLMLRMDNNMVLWTNLIFKDTTKGIVSSALEGLGIKDAVKQACQKANASSHTEVAHIVDDIARTIKGSTYGVTVKHTQKKDGNGVWVNTYIDEVVEPARSTPQYAPQSAAQPPAAFDANEEVPF